MVGRRGQVAVETAMVLPLTLFSILGVVQLTLLEQTRLWVEYAAFQAARAGVVWNGNSERMHDAALFALLPAFGRADDWASLATTWQRLRAHQDRFAALNGSAAADAVNGQTLAGRLRVDTVSPSSTLALPGWGLAGGSDWEELDLDGSTSWPQSQELSKHLSSFTDPSRLDPDQSRYREATELQVRVRFFSELKVPFAGQVLFLAWFAANAHATLYGAIDRSSTTRQGALGRDGDASGLQGLGRGIDHGAGLPSVTAAEMTLLWDLAFHPRLEGRRHVLLPLAATHSMRMQSNFFRKWMVH